MMATIRTPRPHDPVRRRLLLQSLSGAGLLVTGGLLARFSDGGGTMRRAMPDGAGAATPIGQLGALGEPDENGLRLPEGFTARVVARSGKAPVPGGAYIWHIFPDGGATFALPDGGWVYVSNSESIPGGAGALRFHANGAIIDAYRILGGTILNCSGGPTPWGTWLSCEEYEAGCVYECDPSGRSATGRLATRRSALGTFRHEAAAVDPDRGYVYLTEDDPEGGFYRFLCHDYPSLATGTLQIAERIGDDPMARRPVVWHDVPNPNPALVLVTTAFGEFRPGIRDAFADVAGLFSDLGALEFFPPQFRMIGIPTRKQVAASTAFDGGEGIAYHEGIVYFTTKGDNRVWAYDSADESIEIIYDDDLFVDPILTGTDNLIVSPRGDILVAEDGGNMQIVAITPEREIVPVVQVVGQDDSELAGPAFSPDGTRLYFASQRGAGLGITYEMTGPFLRRMRHELATHAIPDRDALGPTS